MDDRTSKEQPWAVARRTELADLRREILSLPADKAMDRILSENHPLPLVHSFSEEDLFFLIHETGPEDSLPVLAMASSRQLNFILDQEVWDKDRIDIGAVSRWIGLMLEADPERFRKWLMHENTELLENFLRYTVELRIREHDEDPSDFGDDFFTFDNIFYHRIISGKNMESSGDDPENRPESDIPETARRLLQEMIFEDHERYRNILLETAQLISAEAEEDAYRWRNVRLSEKGLLPMEEAVEIYQPITAEQLESIRIAGKKAHKSRKPVVLFSESPFQLMHDTPLSDTLTLIEGKEGIDVLQQDFAALCNRIITADQARVKTREDLTAIVKKACGYIRIGLDNIAGMKSSRPEPHELILEYPISAVFKMGFGAALRIKWRAQKWVAKSWFKSRGLSLKFWGEKWVGVLGGVLIKKPLYFDNYKTGVLYREFQSIEEIRQTEKAVDDVISTDNLLSLLDIRFTSAASYGFLSYQNLLLTRWALTRLDIPGDFRLLSVPEFKAFFPTLWKGKTLPRKIAQKAKEDFLNWIASESGLKEDEIAHRMGHVLEALFKEMEDELGTVSENNLDPRYIRHFLLSKTG